MHLLQQAALSRELIKVHIGHDCCWELNASATYWRSSCFLKLINFVYWLNVQSVDVKSWVAYFTSVCVTVDLCRISANLDSYIQSNSFPCFAASSPAGCPEKLPKSPWPFISQGWWINMHTSNLPCHTLAMEPSHLWNNQGPPSQPAQRFSGPAVTRSKWPFTDGAHNIGHTFKSAGYVNFWVPHTQSTQWYNTRAKKER